MTGSRRNPIFSFVLLLLIASVSHAQPMGIRPPVNSPPDSGFLYKPSAGSFWDPTVIYANRQYYMYTMYGGDSVWLATSKDGVHWKDYGVVLHSEGFKNNRVWKQYVSRVGDKYIMNYGAFSAPTSGNDLLRFWESTDLIHWTFLYELPIDTRYYRGDGRWDHMFMVPGSTNDPAAKYQGYMVANPLHHGGFGMMESPDGILKTESGSDFIQLDTSNSWRSFPWLNALKLRKGVVVLNQYFDLSKGIIVEGTIQASSLNAKAPYSRKMYAGFYVEGAEGGHGTAIMLEVGEPQWRASLIGKLSLDSDFHFVPLDVTGRNCATVTGLDNGKTHTFRLWLRGGQVELYVDDLLMQSFFFERASGRIGFIAQESEARFSNLKIYRMNLDD